MEPAPLLNVINGTAPAGATNCLHHLVGRSNFHLGEERVEGDLVSDVPSTTSGLAVFQRQRQPPPSPGNQSSAVRACGPVGLAWVSSFSPFYRWGVHIALPMQLFSCLKTKGSHDSAGPVPSPWTMPDIRLHISSAELGCSLCAKQWACAGSWTGADLEGSSLPRHLHDKGPPEPGEVAEFRQSLGLWERASGP